MLAEEKKKERENQSQSPKSILKNSPSTVKFSEEASAPVVKEEAENLLKLIETTPIEP